MAKATTKVKKTKEERKALKLVTDDGWKEEAAKAKQQAEQQVMQMKLQKFQTQLQLASGLYMEHARPGDDTGPLVAKACFEAAEDFFTVAEVKHEEIMNG